MLLQKGNEKQECDAFMDWCRLRKDIHDFIVHIPNERKCSLRHGAALKRAGVRSGFPDYHLCLPNKKYHALFIEMKRPKPGTSKISDAQKIWIERLNSNGYYATICYGWIAASELVKKYLANEL